MSTIKKGVQPAQVFPPGESGGRRLANAKPLDRRYRLPLQVLQVKKTPTLPCALVTVQQGDERKVGPWRGNPGFLLRIVQQHTKKRPVSAREAVGGGGGPHNAGRALTTRPARLRRPF